MKNILVCYRDRLDSDARSLYASKLLSEKNNSTTFFFHDRQIDDYTVKLLSFFKINKKINIKNLSLALNIPFILYFIYFSVISVIMLLIFKKNGL